MKIGIDAISAIGRSGNATYTRELVSALEKSDTQNSYYLFSFLHDLGRKTPLSRHGRKGWKEVHPYISRSLLPIQRIDMLNDCLMRLVARMRGVELFHFTNPLNFAPGPYKTVVTVHDLAPFHDTAWSKQSLQGVFAQKMHRIIAEADAIIAVSAYTKKDLVGTLRVPEAKITVIEEAASDSYFPDKDPAAIESAFGAGKYLLYAGQLQPRKNALNLVRAWGTIAARHKEYKLILVGTTRDETYLEAIKSAIRESGVESSVVIAGSVEEGLLRKLYSGARGFIYSSFFEGFGLPVLEALRCGTPVITSNTSSLPEVAGDAGLLIDPHKPEEIAAAMERLITDDALHAELQRKALLQAAKFSWKRAAQETLALYERVAAGHR